MVALNTIQKLCHQKLIIRYNIAVINKLELLSLLKEQGIEYSKHEHEPLYTVEDSKNNRFDVAGSHTKNLFLKNKKNYFCLFSCEEKSVVNLKKFSKSINAVNLSFAKEEYLKKYLGVEPGSVSPYALLNDKNNEVEFYLEDTLYNSKKINFHPLINTATISLETLDFIKFMVENKKKINIFSLTNYKIIKTL